MRRLSLQNRRHAFRYIAPGTFHLKTRGISTALLIKFVTKDRSQSLRRKHQALLHPETKQLVDQVLWPFHS